MLGSARVEPGEPWVVGERRTWQLIYTVGAYGIDESGAIAVARSIADDGEMPQAERPGDAGYVTARTDGDAKLRIWYDKDYYIRPWRGCTVVRVYDGALAPGEHIVITFGDRSQVGAGIRAQTFPESRHRVKVLVDPFGTGHYEEIAASPVVSVVPSDPAHLELVAPSFAEPGAPLTMHVRALDRFGNPTPRFQSQVTVDGGTVPAQNLEQGTLVQVSLVQGPLAQCSLVAEDGGVATLSVPGLPQGVHRLRVRSATGLMGFSNPILCGGERPAPRLLWADLHGQTEETIGTGTAEEYLRFARDRGLVDIAAWQGNDLEITSKTWAEVRKQTKAFHAPGRFVTILGYEWSAPTPNGGDHNVYFLGDDEAQVVHSSKWLVGDRSGDQAHRADLLWGSFNGRRDVMGIAHVGGRPANLGCYNPEFVPAIEIHSHHGTFEWFAEEALHRELKVAFVAGSDDHTGRPGLSWPLEESAPGFVSFDVKGGLAGIYAPALTREAVWQALWERRCYATSGDRILLWVEADGHPLGSEYEGSTTPTISGWVEGTDDIWEIELRNGARVIHRLPLMVPDQAETHHRVKVEWSGVRTRGRAKKTRWDGSLRVTGARILAAEGFAFDRDTEGIQHCSHDTVTWRSSTSGDVDGVILDLDRLEGAELDLETPPITLRQRLNALGWEPTVHEAGGVNQRVRLSLISLQPGPKGYRFAFRDERPCPGYNAYWVRVLQRNGAMAWSSPVYYTHVSGGAAPCVGSAERGAGPHG